MYSACPFHSCAHSTADAALDQVEKHPSSMLDLPNSLKRELSLYIIIYLAIKNKYLRKITSMKDMKVFDQGGSTNLLGLTNGLTLVVVQTMYRT